MYRKRCQEASRRAWPAACFDETVVRNIGKTSGQFLRAALWDGSGVGFARVGERLRELERREVAEHGALFPGIHEMRNGFLKNIRFASAPMGALNISAWCCLLRGLPGIFQPG